MAGTPEAFQSNAFQNDAFQTGEGRKAIELGRATGAAIAHKMKATKVTNNGRL